MKIGIIGAGAIGLTAAYELSKAGHTVTVLEASSQHGGLMETVAVGNTKLEKLYHHIFTSDTEIVDMIEELGLKEQMTWQAPKSGIFINGKLYPFSSPLDLLMFKELSLFHRISMGLLIFKAKFLKDWKSLETVGAKDWIIQKSGKKVYEKVWGPLINSKFDHDSDKISAVWIWNKFKLRGSTRGKDIRRELFGYMLGSFGLVYDALCNRVEEMGGKVVCNQPVQRIFEEPDKSLTLITQDMSYTFDKVIFTPAPPILKTLETGLPEEYLKSISEIKYKANICVLLELTKKLSPYYWITVADKSLPFVLSIEHTNLVPMDGYNTHLLYLSRYLDETNELFSASSNEISQLFLGSIKQLFPHFDIATVNKVRVFKERYSQPVVGKEYSKIKPDFKTPLENLYLASMAQIYPEDRGQNYSVRMGKEIAKIVSSEVNK